MSEDMDLLLIILFASIAGFFAVRLYSALGRRDGGEAEAAELAARVRPVSPREEEAAPTFTGPAASGLEDIRRADPQFSPRQFTTGARQAYEMIATAFADGDRDTLRSLLSDKVYAKFDAGITSREERGLRQVSDLVQLHRSDIESARMIDGVAEVVVRFEAEIASGLTDADGAVVEGDPSRINRVAELWTFRRDVASDSPIWLLSHVGKP